MDRNTNPWSGSPAPMNNNQRHTPEAAGESPTGQRLLQGPRNFGQQPPYSFGNQPVEYGEHRPALPSPGSGFGSSVFYNNDMHNASPHSEDVYHRSPYNPPYTHGLSFNAGPQNAGSRPHHSALFHNGGTINGHAGPGSFGDSPQEAHSSPFAAHSPHSFNEHPSNLRDGTYDEGSESRYPDPDQHYHEDKQSADEGSDFIDSGEYGDDGDDGGDYDGEENYTYPADAGYATGYRAIIKGEADYHKKKDLRRKNKIRNVHLDEIPTTDSQKLEWIGKLFEAIKNMDDIIDQPGKDNREPQAVVKIKKGNYPDDHIELACWGILLDTIDSAKGHKLVEPYHKTKWEDNDQVGGFEGRMERIIKGLRESKAVCKQVLDPLYRHRLVDAPLAEFAMKSANKKLNANRDVQNRIGRAVITKGVEAVSADELARLKLNTPASRGKGRAAPGSMSVKGEQTPEDIKTFSYASMSTSKSKNALATPSRSTGKRQRPTSTRSGKGKVKIESDDDDSDESDGFSDDNYGDTPTKRRVIGARSSTKARGRTDSALFHNAAATPSRRRSVRAAAITANATIHNAIEGLEEPSEESEELMRMDLDNQYKKRICDVLEVGYTFADQLDLSELRTYARAFNAIQGNTAWVLPGSSGARCIGQTVFGLAGHPKNADGITEVHMTSAFSWCKTLALARGDLLPDLTLNPNGPRCFNSDGIPEIDEALGFLDNPFGIFA